jgi:hypothetical protein
MANDTLDLATQLAAARIVATGGQPLSLTAIRLCLVEAYVLEHERSQVGQGIGLNDRRQVLHEQLSAEYRAELKQRSLEGSLPAGATGGDPAPRL